MVLTYGSVIQLPEQVQPLKVARLSASIPAARGANGGKSTPRIHFPESGYRRCSGKTLQPDWQTYDFVPGSLITVRLDNMTNIPEGMDWGVIDGNLINISVGPSDDSGAGRSMHVWRSTVSKANYRFLWCVFQEIREVARSPQDVCQLLTKPRHGRRNKPSAPVFQANCPAMLLQQQS